MTSDIFIYRLYLYIQTALYGIKTFLFIRFHNDGFEKVPIFLFGDFNFRLNTQAVVKVRAQLCSSIEYVVSSVQKYAGKRERKN